jgi:hypothetical protein
MEVEGGSSVAAAVRQPYSTLTRRAFLLAVCGGALALAIGRRVGGPLTTVGRFRPKRADNLLEERRGDALDLRPIPLDDHGPTFRLNGPGACVWRHIDGDASVDDLATQLAAAYDLPPVATRADTMTFLGSMMQVGLVFDPAG